LWLPLDATGIGVLVGSPDLADRDREQPLVVVSSKVVTTWATAVRTLGR